jgi:predicted MPP superfamily phosphohydrolase
MHKEIFTTNKDIKETKIAIFSDIHYYPEYNTKIFDRLIKQLQNNKPDYIAILGDILDSADTSDFKALEEFLKTITNIAPTIVVLGNHDTKKGYMRNWSYYKNVPFLELLKSINNLTLLEDEKYLDKEKNICFYGFSPSYEHYEIKDEDYESFIEEVNELKTKLDTKTYNICLTHSPINIYRFIKENQNHNLANTDLVLSGHMHNGAIPYFFSNIFNKTFKTSRSIISPTRELFPKYSQGRIYNDVVDGYIYEGLSKLSKSTKSFHKFDFIYSKNVHFLTIKKSSK